LLWPESARVLKHRNGLRDKGGFPDSYQHDCLTVVLGYSVGVLVQTEPSTRVDVDRQHTSHEISPLLAAHEGKFDHGVSVHKVVQSPRTAECLVVVPECHSYSPYPFASP
jgi:hypothetical protein